MEVLLLQAREADDEARHEERLSFAAAAGLPPDAVHCHDMLASPPSLADIKRYRALLIGGSGDYYVSKRNLPGFDAVLGVLRAVVDCGHPTFASCFGFQLLVQALGGEVVYDPSTMQVGTYDLALTADGEQDELFSRLSVRFSAQLGRKDRATQLPPGVVNLATSAAVPYMALRVPGKPIWATQFHPELTREDNLKRFRRYMSGYVGILSNDELEATLQRFAPSPEAFSLLAAFVATVAEGPAQ